MKTMDRKFNNLNSKMEKSLKEIQERLDMIGETQLKHFSRQNGLKK